MKKRFRVLFAGLALAASLTFMGGSVLTVFAATATVTADKCNVRSEASTSSEAVFSVSSGQKLEVVGSVSGSDGFTWYKVEDGGKTGYIRADLVSEPDGPVKSDTADKPANDEPKADDAPAVEEVPATVGSSDATKGVVTTDGVTVRSGGSKETSKVGTAKSGQEVNISGETTDSEGMKWYQVSFADGNNSVNGYIRSDFLQITETAADIAPEVETTVEDAEPVEVVMSEQPADYECRFEANSDGIEEWFLYDHINGTKQSINNIYAVMKQSQDNAADSDDSSGILKIIVIVMAVVIVGLIAALVVLLLKSSRDHYVNFEDIDRDDDYDYESEDDNIDAGDYMEESDDYYAEEEEEEEEYVRPKKLGRGAKKSRRSKRGAFDFDDEDDEDDDEEAYKRPTRRGSRSYNTENEAWSTTGMLDIDDDMEFEFLDLDK